MAAIARLALYAGYNSKTPAHNQLFVSETAHLITLLAGAGPVLMRTTVHGMAVNLIQSLYVSKADDTIVAPKLKAILEEAHSKEVLAMFGLISTGPVGDYAVLEEGSDVLSVDALEGLAKLMIKILTLGAQSSCKFTCLIRFSIFDILNSRFKSNQRLESTLDVFGNFNSLPRFVHSIPCIRRYGRIGDVGRGRRSPVPNPRGVQE